MNPHYAIEVSNLTKIYDNQKLALSDVNLRIPSGSIAGLLGPNGAGKSTFINILSGSVIKTSGRVYANGFDIDDNPRELRGSLGVVPQDVNFDPFFTPQQSLRLQAGLYGIRDNVDEIVRKLLKQMHLSEQANYYSRRLSGGMKRRLLIAKALVHNPPILFLDEPTAGVDIQLRHELWELVLKLNKENGTTIILTTHYLEEAEKLCDSITIINHGRCIASESKEALMQRFEKGLIYIKADNASKISDEKLRYLELELLPDGRLLKTFDNKSEKPFNVLSKLHEAGISITNMEIARPNLSDIFLHLTQDSDNQKVSE